MWVISGFWSCGPRPRDSLESLCLLPESQEKPGILFANCPLWLQCLSSICTLPTDPSHSADTAQCLKRRRDPVRGRACQDLSTHTRGCVQSAEGKVCPESSLFMRRSHGTPCSTLLTEGVEGIVFVITFQYVTVSLFILLLRGLERIHEYQTKTCSPGELCPGPCNARAGRDPRHHLA